MVERRSGAGEGMTMGQPVVHLEVVGRDGPLLRAFYAELFG